MKTSKPGSLIVEALIYLALSVIVISGAISWFAHSQRSLVQIGIASNAAMALYSATDLLVRDLRMCPRNKQLWKRTGPGSIIWHSPQGDVGWVQQDEKLYRVIGTYDALAQKWVAQKRSIVLQNIKQLVFEVSELFQEIQYIEYALTLQVGGMAHAAHERVYMRQEII